jgi:DNA-binding GntR family transcriptional regulator
MNQEKTEILAIKQVTLVSLVRRYIEREIRAGRIKVDEKVKEAVIARELSVSRGPVREACNQLTEAGWLVSFPQRGSFVRKVSFKEAMDIYEIRIGLAGTVAACAAERATDAQIAKIRAIVPKMWTANSTSDIDAINEMTEAFHTTLAEMTSNEVLARTYAALLCAHRLFRVDAMQRLGGFEVLLAKNNREAILMREQIIDAITQRNGVMAARLYVQYFEESRQRSFECYSEAMSHDQDASSINGGPESPVVAPPVRANI